MSRKKKEISYMVEVDGVNKSTIFNKKQLLEYVATRVNPRSNSSMTFGNMRIYSVEE